MDQLHASAAWPTSYLTDEQFRIAAELRPDGAGVKRGAGTDVFVYCEDDDGSTVRLQVGPRGEVVDRRRFDPPETAGTPQ